MGKTHKSPLSNNFHQYMSSAGLLNINTEFCDVRAVQRDCYVRETFPENVFRIMKLLHSLHFLLHLFLPAGPSLVHINSCIRCSYSCIRNKEVPYVALKLKC